MIHHISIAAERPQHVAKVLAELWNGQVTPFPSHAGSYAVLACDASGTMIEVYPLGTELQPGTDQQPVEFGQSVSAPLFNAFHAAISVPVEQEKIEQIGVREGWRVLRCNRGPFEVIEVWVENRWLLELLPSSLAAQYLTFMQPQNLEKYLADASA